MRRLTGEDDQLGRAEHDSEIEPAIAGLAHRGAGALLVAQDVFFNSRRSSLTTLAANYKLPAIYNQREYVQIGGFASYGCNGTGQVEDDEQEPAHIREPDNDN